MTTLKTMYTLCSGPNNSHFQHEIEVFSLYRDAVKAYNECNKTVKVIFKLTHNKNGELVSRECKKFKSAPGSCNSRFLQIVSGLE